MWIWFSHTYERYLIFETFQHFPPLKTWMKTALWSRHRVRPWLLEVRLHHCMYKVEEKAPLTLDTDWIKHSFMKHYEMPWEVQGLIWDQGWNGLKYLINSSKCHWDVPDRVLVSFEKHILKVCHTFLRELTEVKQLYNTENNWKILLLFFAFCHCWTNILIYPQQGSLYLILCFQRSENIKKCQAMPVKAILMHFWRQLWASCC